MNQHVRDRGSYVPLNHNRRRRIAKAIELLINLLDEEDASSPACECEGMDSLGLDPDLEDDDERELTWPESAGGGSIAALFGTDDDEDSHDQEGIDEREGLCW